MTSIQTRIWLERAGILNEQVKKEHSFYHPFKGIYKLSHHPEINVYHLHNKFGDLTHTFSGHMSPEEIAKDLRNHHDMILIDKLHEEKLDELKKPGLSPEEKERQDSAKKASRSINIHRGGYNESLIAKHLNSNKFIDNEHKLIHEHHKKALLDHDKKYGTNEVKTQEDRAKEQVHVFKEHAKQKGYEGINKVHLTSKPGDIERKTGIKATQQENPSDVSVEFDKKPKTAKHGHLGLSAKSSASKSIGFHNGGTKDIGNFLTHHLGD
jgi:hypothetical protein